MTDLCGKVSNCYGSIKCQESMDKKNKMDGLCEESQYLFGDVPECVKWFFKEIYTMNYYECLKEYDFFSYNLTIKRDAFLSGELCVRKVINESQFFECDREAAEFIDASYNKVVDYLTINPGSKPCQGVYPQFQKLQCKVYRDIWDKKNDELIDEAKMNQTIVNEFIEIGRIVKECMSHSCLYNAKDFREIEFRCGMAKYEASDVLACFMKIKDMNVNLSDRFSCLKEAKSSKEKRECKLEVYSGVCGDKARESYEENEGFLRTLVGNLTLNED